jgi:hypothetical protein
MRLSFAVLASLGSLFACPRPPQSIAKYIESAREIVVANLVYGDLASNQFVLHIQRVIKGESVPGAEVAAHFETYLAEPPVESEEIPRINGIFFLNPDSRGYTVPDLDCAPVNLPPDAPPGAPGDTPAASVANEIVSALHWIAQGDFYPEVWGLAEALGSLDSSITQPIYRQFVDDQSPFMRELGIHGLISANDPEGVKLAVEITTASPLIAGSLQSYSNPDPSGIAALSKLALRDPGLNEPIIQRSATAALSMIHTKETLPALAKLLDSKDEGNRWQAIFGFCQFASSPEIEHYCEGLDQAIDINFWKSWWTTHQ